MPVLLLALAVAGFYWKLTLTGEYVWFDHPDMCYMELPRLQMQAREFQLGRFPLWDPYIFFGQPHIGQTQPGPLYPGNLVLSLLPLRDGTLDPRWLNWYFVISHIIAAIGAFALCRDLRRSRGASLLAACAFSFGGFFGTVPWLDVANSAAWTPLVALFFLRAAQGRAPLRNTVLAGAMLGLTWLSGHHEIPVLTSLALAPAWAYAAWRRGWRATAPYAAAMFATSALVGAAQLLPTAEFARLSVRWVGGPVEVDWYTPIPYTVPTVYSMPVRGLLEIFVASGWRYADTTPFLGVTIASLAVAALLRRRRDARVRWMAALAGASLVFALGALSPVHGILYSLLPVVSKARVPVRATHFLALALCVLAAFGMDALLGPGGSATARRRLARVLAAFGALVVAARITLRPDMDESVLAAGAAAFAVAAVLSFSRSRGFALAALALVAAAELHPVSTGWFSHRNDEKANRYVSKLGAYDDIAAFLRSEPAPLRVRVHGEDIAINFGEWYGIDVMEGYLAGVSANVARTERHPPEVNHLLGITHFVSREPLQEGLEEVFRGSSGVKVYRNRGAFPRAWAVHRVESHEAVALRARLRDPAFDGRTTALITGGAAPVLDNCTGSEVDIAAYAPNRVRLRARMACRGMVILSDTFYPGWVARVDGVETPIRETYGIARGIVVESGKHDIDFSFRPRSVLAGAALTLLGLAGTLAVCAATRSRDTRRTRAASGH